MAINLVPIIALLRVSDPFSFGSYVITRGVIAMVVMGWGITNLAIIRAKKHVKKIYVYHPSKRTLRLCTIKLRVYYLLNVAS